MTPVFLAFLAAALLFVSGMVKLRTASRAELGLHLPSLLELLVALALPAVAMGGGLAPGTGFLAVTLALLLLLGSSVHLTLRLRRRTRYRERTEGRRLETFVRYISEPEDGAP